MSKATMISVDEIKVGDVVLSSEREGSEVVTKVHVSGKFVHVTTASGKKTYSRKATIARIDN